MTDEEAILAKEITHAELLAKSLVVEVWNMGVVPAIFDVEYEGARWAVSVQVEKEGG